MLLFFSAPCLLMVDPTDGVLGEQINAQLTKCSKIMDAQGKFCLEVRTTCSILHHYCNCHVTIVKQIAPFRRAAAKHPYEIVKRYGSCIVAAQFLDESFSAAKFALLSPKDSRRLIIDDRTITHVPRFCKASLKPSNKSLKLYGSRYAADQFSTCPFLLRNLHYISQR